MNLYSGKDCPHSQRARIVAFEKDITLDIAPQDIRYMPTVATRTMESLPLNFKKR